MIIQISKQKERHPNRNSWQENVFIHTCFILMAVICILPVILVCTVSISSQDSISRYGYQFIPRILDFSAYAFLLKSGSAVYNAYGITLIVTSIGTALSVFMMALYAYPISRRDFPFKRFFSYFLFIPMLFNGGLVPMYLVYTQLLHIQNTIWAMIVPMLIAPFNVFIMRTFFETTIPPELIEAAKIDGASEFGIYLKIVIPLSIPVIATMSLFMAIAYWNDWFLSLIFIRNTKLYSLQYLLMSVLKSAEFLSKNLKSIGQVEATILPGETTKMAMAVLGMGPIIMMYPFFQRYFVKGMVIGAVKG